MSIINPNKCSMRTWFKRTHWPWFKLAMVFQQMVCLNYCHWKISIHMLSWILVPQQTINPTTHVTAITGVFTLNRRFPTGWHNLHQWSWYHPLHILTQMTQQSNYSSNYYQEQGWTLVSALISPRFRKVSYMYWKSDTHWWMQTPLICKGVKHQKI